MAYYGSVVKATISDESYLCQFCCLAENLENVEMISNLLSLAWPIPDCDYFETL